MACSACQGLKECSHGGRGNRSASCSFRSWAQGSWNDPVPAVSAQEAQFRRMSPASSPGPSGDRHPRTPSQFPREFQKSSETLAPEGVQESQLFLEVFSGSANLTLSMRRAGWNTLPPIDIEIVGLVLESCDVMDPQFCARAIAWLRSGKLL